MDDLKAAVRLLLDNSRTIPPEALDVLRTSNDPVGLAERIIESTAPSTIVDRPLLVRLLRGKTPQQDSSPRTSRLPSRPRNRSSLLSQLINKTPSTTPVGATSSVPKSQTSINTSLEELSSGLHGYESKLEIIRDPLLSDNLVGDINDMVGYFQNRYKKLSKIFRGRSDIHNLTKIRHIKRNQRDISVIGMLTEKVLTSEDSGRLILEDPTSEHSLEVVLSSEELIEKALHTMTDSVICVQGMVSDKGTFYAEKILLPDVPHRSQNAKKTADVPVHVAFLSDIHIGSKGFLSDPMEKFIQFLNGEYGNIKEQKLGLHTKYVMFSGDVVDGVGIYPGQIEDLAMDSIHDQYNTFASFVERIPEDVEVVVIPGNHDMVRSAEPQPRISPQFAPDLANLSNVRLLPNPSQVSLHGVQTLLYHCTSLPDILNHIPGLSIDKPVDVMVHMLQARHLAPIWGDKTPIATEPEDHLVIDPLPDIFHGGHVHINGYGGYHGVQIINSGTMQEQTSFQKSLNIDPTPGLVPLINLHTRKPSLLDFMSG